MRRTLFAASFYARMRGPVGKVNIGVRWPTQRENLLQLDCGRRIHPPPAFAVAAAPAPVCGTTRSIVEQDHIREARDTWHMRPSIVPPYEPLPNLSRPE